MQKSKKRKARRERLRGHRKAQNERGPKRTGWSSRDMDILPQHSVMPYERKNSHPKVAMARRVVSRLSGAPPVASMCRGGASRVVSSEPTSAIQYRGTERGKAEEERRRGKERRGEKERRRRD